MQSHYIIEIVLASIGALSLALNVYFLKRWKITVNNFHKYLEGWRAQYRESSRLRAALVEYGVHLSNCNLKVHSHPEDWTQELLEEQCICNCGFTYAYKIPLQTPHEEKL